MTSSVPTPKVEDQALPKAVPSVRSPWWRDWVKPVVVVAVVSVLVAALTFITNLGTAAFQTLRADIRDVKTDLREEIKASEARQREEIKASEARQRQELRETKAELRQEIQGVREEVKASEARQRQELRETKAELKADNQAVTERLDRMFERLPAPPSGQ